MPLPDRRDILALALPSPDLDLDLDPADVVLTAHAVRRYQERVEGVSRRLAVRGLGRLVATAQWRSRPRAWTEIVLHPGVVYGYSADRPDVCLLLRQHAVVTVLSRRAIGRGRRAEVPQQTEVDRAGRHESDGRRATDRGHPSPLQRCHRAASDLRPRGNPMRSCIHSHRRAGSPLSLRFRHSSCSQGADQTCVDVGLPGDAVADLSVAAGPSPRDPPAQQNHRHVTDVLRWRAGRG